MNNPNRGFSPIAQRRIENFKANRRGGGRCGFSWHCFCCRCSPSSSPMTSPCWSVTTELFRTGSQGLPGNGVRR
ncbi:MAG: hypothetical protein CM1200mP20_13770 [Pseudomonadota bacterium]|nr:MAG: hypothetical protein CM1200mP20_13770 [Pseudomonadota bacterium]